VANWEDLLASAQGADQTRITATRPKPKRPAVISQKDMLGPSTPATEGFVAPGTKPPEPGGWKGFVYDVMSSPLGKVVTEAGNILSYPGRLVTSGVQELADWRDSDPNTNASWDDLFKQAADPEFGFGKVIGNLTGSSFVNRALGFAGDVLLDPLTYVTFGGAKAFSETAKLTGKAGRAARRISSLTSQEGRLALANRLAELGAEPSLVLDAVRRGRAAVKDADLLAKAGYSRAGVYWFGKRIPMTTKLGTVAEGSLTSLRVWSGDHVFKRLSSLFTPRDMHAIRVALARGERPSTEESVDLLKLVVSRNAERAEWGAAGRKAGVYRNQLTKAVSKEDLQSARATAYKYLDVAGKQAPSGSAAERVANGVRQFLDNLGRDVYNTAKAIDPEAPVQFRENYFPHITTDKALQWMSDDGSSLALTVRDQVFNPLDNVSAWKTRMEVGDDFFGKILTEEDLAGGIDSLNKIARDFGKLDFDFFETDLPTVLDKYVDAYTKQMGIIARRKSMIDSGVYKKLDSLIEVNPEIERAFQNELTAAVKSRATARNKAIKAFNDFTSFSESFITSEMKAADQEASGAMKNVLDAFAENAGSGMHKHMAQQALDAAKNALLIKQHSLAAVMGERPPVLDLLEESYNSTLKQIDEISAELTRTETVSREVIDRMSVLSKEWQELDKKELAVIQKSNIIQSEWYSIVSGGNPAQQKTLAENVRKALFGEVRVEGGMSARVSGSRPSIADKEQFDSLAADFRKEMKIPKNKKLTVAQNQIVRDRYERAGGKFIEGEVGIKNQKWFMDAQGDAPINLEKIVKAIEPERVKTTLKRAIAGEASLEEMRALGMAMLVARNDIAPELRTRMEQYLAEAAKANSYLLAFNKANRSGRGVITVQRILDNYATIERAIIDDLTSHAAASNLLIRLGDVVGKVDMNQPIAYDILASIVDDNQYSSLRNLLSPFLGSDDNYINIRALANMQEGFEASDLAGLALRGPGVNAKSTIRDLGDMAMVNSIEETRSITWNELIDVLKGHMTEVNRHEFDISFAIQDVVRGELKNTSRGSRYINIGNMINSMTYELGNAPSMDEVENFIDKIITGKVEKDSVRTGVITGRVMYDPSSEKESLRALINDARRKLNEQNKIAYYDVQGQKDVAAVRRAVQEGKATGEALKQAKAEATAAFGKTIQEFEYGGTSVDDIRREFGNLLMETHFRSEVQLRFDRVVDLMAKEGFVANESMFRAVINAVARDSSTEVRSHLSGLTRVEAKMREVLDVIESSDWTGRSQELYNRLQKIVADDTFDNDRSVALITKLNGTGSAAELYAEFQRYGGKAGDSGFAWERKKLALALKNDMLTPEQRLALQKELESLPTPKQLSAKKAALKKGKLLDWWRAHVDPSATSLKDAEIVATLKEYKAIKSSSGRLTEDASPLEMKRWAQSTLQKAQESGRTMRQRTGWLMDASDPFVDVRQLKFTGNSIQDLPGWYANSLSYGARRLEAANEKFNFMLNEAIKAELTIEEFIYRIDAENPDIWNYRDIVVNEALNLPKGAKLTDAQDVLGVLEMQDLRAMRAMHNKIAEVESSPEYMRALVRQDEQSIIEQMVPYAASSPFDLYYQLPRHKVAKNAFDSGQTVYVKLGIKDYTAINEAASVRNQINATVKKNIELNTKWQAIDPTVKGAMAKRAAIEEEIKQLEATEQLLRAQMARIESTIEIDAKWEAQDYKLIQNPAEITEGNTYFIPKTDSTLGDVARVQRRIKQLAKAGKTEEADALQKQLDSSLRPLLESPIIPFVVRDSSGAPVHLGFEPWEIEMLFNFHGDSKLLASQLKETQAGIVPPMRQYAGEITAAEQAGKIGDEAQRAAYRMARSEGMSEEEARRYAMTVSRSAAKQREARLPSIASMRKDIEDADIAAARAEVMFEGATANSAKQKSVLQKIHWIAQAIGNGDITIEDVANAFSYTARTNKETVYTVDSNFVRWRKGYIDRVWADSKEAELLGTVDELRNSAEEVAYNKTVRETGKVVKTVTEMRNAARKAWGDVHAPQPGAPYGYKPWNIGDYSNIRTTKYQELIDAGVAPKEAEKQAQEFARTQAYKVPYEKPVVGVAGAKYELDRISDELTGYLESITRTTKEQYNALERYAALRSDGASIGEAVDTIAREVVDLHPQADILVTSAKLNEFAFRKAQIEAEIGFLKSIYPGDTYEIFGIGMTRTQTLEGTRAKLIKNAKEMEKELKKAWKAEDVATAKMERGRAKLVEQETKDVIRAEEALLEASKKFDSSHVNYMDAQKHAATVVPSLARKAEGLRTILDKLNAVKDRASDDLLAVKLDMEEWLKESEELLAEVGHTAAPESQTAISGEAGHWLTDAYSAYVNRPVAKKDYEKLLRLKADYLEASSAFVMRERQAAAAENMLLNLRDGYWGKRVVQQLNEGMVSLERLGLPSYQAAPELEEISRNMSQMLEPSYIRALNRVIGKYTGFFKSYATSTPGFVVRNAMQNTFMLVAAGASPKNMSEGLGWYRKFTQAVDNGTHEAWLASLNETDRFTVGLAIKAADASGYGKTSDAFLMWKPKRAGLTDNKYTRLFRTRNEAVEGSARFMLAYDSVVRGLDFNQATARVKRYLFDYTDVGVGDAIMRPIVPFWFWMSRNLPLQIMNQWQNPRAYNIYQDAMNNLGVNDDEDKFLPSWMKEQGAVKVGDNLYVMMDMGFNRVGQQFEEFSDPARLLSYVNPILRLPFETIFGDRKFYRNVPFRDEDQQTAGGPLKPAVQLLAELLFQGRDLPSGERGSSERFNYAVQNLVPLLGQVERIMPSTDYNEERQLSNIFGYLGIPLRGVTASQREAEQRRQENW